MATSTIEGGNKFKTFLDNLIKQKAKLDVGFFPESKYKNGTQVAMVAIWQEFGTESKDKKNHIPPRPFLHPTYDEQKDKWFKIFQRTILKQGDDINIKTALTTVGFVAQKDVQKKIDEWADAGGNAPRTIVAKGFDSPLIETGHLRESVEFRVTTK